MNSKQYPLVLFLVASVALLLGGDAQAHNVSREDAEPSPARPVGN